ncbi:hypothetical protein Pse7367_0599 [Thalassoporum mexicanum PCC 7367]|uniref:hypothetical protein n=1 Tax=Thalassoporum mexicanum TaxID=3457544 RepID=UPI00029FD45C|nr:hypothetical protein [Pseudanabaena sp. PCC 7367]AFY68903.1 hypothetical protein Pse7367_0599 [Pseudanabaena sp. PCC 7367]
MNSKNSRLAIGLSLAIVNTTAIGMINAGARSASAQNISIQSEADFRQKAEQLAPGSYLYGEVEAVNEPGKQYLVFFKTNEGKAIGQGFTAGEDASYCFQGTIIEDAILATTFAVADPQVPNQPIEVADGEDLYLERAFRSRAIPRDVMLGLRNCTSVLSSEAFRSAEGLMVEIEPESAVIEELVEEAIEEEIIEELVEETVPTVVPRLK